MDSGWIAALTSLVSTLVISVTAIAAFRQLKHYRNANDIVVYLRLIDRMDSEDVRIAREMLRTTFDGGADEPEAIARRFSTREAIRELWPIIELLRFLEHISVLVIKGEIAENLILAEYAEIFVEIWTQSRASISVRREALGPFTGAAFEHLAMRSKRYIESGTMAREYAALERDPETPAFRGASAASESG